MKNLERSLKSGVKKQQGYSLIELSIALAIVSVILVGALTGVQSILRNNSVNTQLKTSQLAITKLISATLRQPDMTDVSTANMIALGVWPQEVLVDTVAPVGPDTVVNAFGGAEGMVVVGNAITDGAEGGGTVLYAANQAVDYVLSSVPTEVCSQLVQGLEASAIAIGVVRASGAAAAATNFNSTTASVVKPARGTVDIGRLGTQCALGALVDVHLAVTRT